MLTGYWAWLLASGHLTWHIMQIPKWINSVWGLPKWYPYSATSEFWYLYSGVVPLHCPITRWGTTDLFSQMVTIIQEMTSQEWIESILGWALSVLWKIFLLLQMLHGHIMINWSASLETNNKQGFMSLLITFNILPCLHWSCMFQTAESIILSALQPRLHLDPTPCLEMLCNSSAKKVPYISSFWIPIPSFGQLIK